MNDTSDEVAALVAERYRHMSGAERVRIAAGMFDTARALILASESATGRDDWRAICYAVSTRNCRPASCPAKPRR